ncbi:WXG100 family type VII secretion target [Kitasatospora sp. NPDC051853]|uniref:WXG100 family type VII secretion target n=1 Tax=Kitasatospora sp. NPDC051853 TaxID=3364058 RepID=UPI0037ADD78E
MGDKGFRVEPGALRQYAALVEAQAERIAEIQSRLASVSLNSNDFGKLPDAQNLYEAYQEHAEAERENLTDLTEILADTAGGLQDTADNYANHDVAIASVYGGGQ